MAGVKDGFGVAIGVFLAFTFIVALGVMTMCGGCAALFGVGATSVAVVGNEALKEQVERDKKEEAAKRKAKPKIEVEEPPKAEPEMNQAAPPSIPKSTPESAAKEPAPTPETKPEDDAEKKAEAEQQAANKLRLAKIAGAKNDSVLIKRLKAIVEEFPGTEAAKEAQSALEKKGE